MGRLSCSDNSLIYNEITKRTYSKDTDTDRELVQNMSQHLETNLRTCIKLRFWVRAFFIESHKLHFYGPNLIFYCSSLHQLAQNPKIVVIDWMPHVDSNFLTKDKCGSRYPQILRCDFYKFSLAWVRWMIVRLQKGNPLRCTFWFLFFYVHCQRFFITIKNKISCSPLATSRLQPTGNATGVWGHFWFSMERSDSHMNYS